MLNFVAALLGVLGSLASLLALYLTWRIAQRLNEIERRYRRQAVLPEFSGKLVRHNADLERCLANNRNDAANVSMARIRATLVNLLEYLDESQAADVRRLVSRIETAMGANTSTTFKSRCVQVAVDLHGVIESVENFETELAWRRRDA